MRIHTMAYYYITVLTVALFVLSCSASLTCYNCTGVTNMDRCQDEVSCDENEVCFKKERYSGAVNYDLGCIPSKKCGKFANISGIDSDKGQTQSCFECCSRDRCNIDLCEYKDPSLCVDDEGFDCAFLNSLFNLCKNVNLAKKVCPKYCKLCQVVDGNWTPWSNWSDCDITCENGTRTRTRSCTNPEPQKGGLDCLGYDTETKSCNREPCPIHDGWTSWSSWSECSVSCDIGMQHRDRFCRPSLFEYNCFGNSRDDRICMPGACTGDDGRWSTWGSWGTCSESCEGGIMSRNRACTNPATSMTGKQCVGNSEQVSLCNKQSCPEHNVAFTAYNLERSLQKSTTLLFRNTYTNYGSGYSTTTGKFTCQVPGVYHFVVTLVKYYQDVNSIRAYLSINGSNKLTLRFYIKADDSNEVGIHMMTGAGIFHLDKNDAVDVYGVPYYFATDSYSYFTGFLITSDQ